MINHVTQVVSHYRGQVFAWDVVNEAVGTTASRSATRFFTNTLALVTSTMLSTRPTRPTRARCFSTTTTAPKGQGKSDYVYNMVKGMLARGVPINGVGLQMHTGPADTSPSAAQYCGQHAAAGGPRAQCPDF